MHRNPTIRVVLAFVLLVIFSLSITPKRIFHDLFAGHTDYTVKPASDGKVHITETGFNCDCDTLVATSPFTEHTDETEITVLPVYPSLFISLTTPVYTSSHSFAELRGPPSLG